MNQELSANTTLSNYRIVSKIGAGGMGEVYLAEDTTLNRKVAIKVLPAELANHKDRLKRFEQEAQAVSALNHPNILTIYEFGSEGDSHFIVMEFVEGLTLRDKIATGIEPFRNGAERMTHAGGTRRGHPCRALRTRCGQLDDPFERAILGWPRTSLVAAFDSQRDDRRFDDLAPRVEPALRD